MYQSLNSRNHTVPSYPVFQIVEETKDIQEEKEDIQEEKEEKEEESVYCRNKNSFIMETLNRSCNLYKLMHNEMVFTNEKLNLLEKHISDFENNLIELNIIINRLDEKLGEISKSLEPKKADEPSSIKRKTSISKPANSPRQVASTNGRPLLKSSSFKKT
jgi:predicted nuclease with TOPRIM domain